MFCSFGLALVQKTFVFTCLHWDKQRTVHTEYTAKPILR